MHADASTGTGKRIAYQRRLARLTQQELARAADVALGTVRKIESGERGVGEAVLDAIAAALGVDVACLLPRRDRADDRVHRAMPQLSAALATYDMPEDGPTRPLSELREAVAEAVTWRLAAQYVRISCRAPELLTELGRAFHGAPVAYRAELAELLVAAYRAADAMAYKYGAYDLSARLVDLMRWAVSQAEDPLLEAAVVYTRAETYFAAEAHAAGLRVLERALDALPRRPVGPAAVATRGALHMRAAVMAGRAGDAAVAATHLSDARSLAARVPEAVYRGTGFGPDTVRIHELSVAVSLGNDDVRRALDAVSAWAPPVGLAAERRSGFFIELARAQLWSGRPDQAFASLKTARHIAPQHTREHKWVREDAATLRRLKRGDSGSLSAFAEWCRAGG
ncbi:helix-turn-helix domain-containing protein [Streptomyces paromomycinus]|uniref:Transcriptional regulator n=1 Tax=Streptomyces paromomycinus TaxID=92743 RepID=A0A401WBI9_STREY|nr:helix-turn-helix transcriptional regulator [Streptomyces paromomycinus]GCD46704.1 transcriptional regulator [Streptomyces paromomycinus]